MSHQVVLLLVQPPGVCLRLELLLSELGLEQPLLELGHAAQLPGLLVTPVTALEVSCQLIVWCGMQYLDTFIMSTKPPPIHILHI